MCARACSHVNRLRAHGTLLAARDPERLFRVAEGAAAARDERADCRASCPELAICDVTASGTRALVAAPTKVATSPGEPAKRSEDLGSREHGITTETGVREAEYSVADIHAGEGAPTDAEHGFVRGDDVDGEGDVSGLG